VTFVQICFFTLKPTTSLLMNWHIKAIAFQLERIRLGQQKRLYKEELPDGSRVPALNHGKSNLTPLSRSC
jgi:hypothetical protein